jgi:hypothetical protein
MVDRFLCQAAFWECEVLDNYRLFEAINIGGGSLLEGTRQAG